MQEIELKFQVPPAQRAAVAKAMATAQALTTRMQAIYFDTPGRHLAKAGIAVRLRKEGRRWVQTLKAGGADAMSRFEHNVMVAGSAEPMLDLARHAGTPAEARLADALRGLGPDERPVERFRTDVRRVHREVRVKGALLELAYDHGRIVAGEQVLPLCELEIELLRGDPQALLAVARRWVQRHQLWLDVRSKAERGDRLARGHHLGTPRKATPSTLKRGATRAEAWRESIRHCLAQILPNASDIAGETAGDEHVHQLRVGLRRLRSLQRFLGDETLTPCTEVEAEVAALFGALGGTRDRDVLAATLMPALQQAGAPLVELPPPQEADPVDALLRVPATTLLWLSLLAASLPPSPAAAGVASPTGEAPDANGSAEPVPQATADASRSVAANDAVADLPPEPAIDDFVARRLNRWHRRVVGQAAEFLTLSDEERHRVRKQAKRLRYAAEFAAPLYSKKKVERYLEPLRPLQEALGEFNDLHVAELAYHQLTGGDGRAWFAVGWLAAQRAALLDRCMKTLSAFAKAKRYWRD